MDFNDNKYTVDSVELREQDDKTEVLLEETS